MISKDASTFDNLPEEARAEIKAMRQWLHSYHNYMLQLAQNDQERLLQLAQCALTTAVVGLGRSGYPFHFIVEGVSQVAIDPDIVQTAQEYYAKGGQVRQLTPPDNELATALGETARIAEFWFCLSLRTAPHNLRMTLVCTLAGELLSNGVGPAQLEEHIERAYALGLALRSMQPRIVIDILRL